ncbi:ribosomal-processing cysteine protease Prp [Treponema sp. TIM-1]|uniref:ribosomal-processing cysteine protease Prp n=1 Tax=Treponema sp. TIM-1 TaxID=2898417 RepID=UPI00397FCEC0
MITIDVVLDVAGILKSCKVTGHAGAGPKGYDIVCAAVSILTKTALKTLTGREGIIVRVPAGVPERGRFGMETDYTGNGRDFLAAAGAFLLEGLVSVSEAYPDYCTMNIHNERRK